MRLGRGKDGSVGMEHGRVRPKFKRRSGRSLDVVVVVVVERVHAPSHCWKLNRSLVDERATYGYRLR